MWAKGVCGRYSDCLMSRRLPTGASAATLPNVQADSDYRRNWHTGMIRGLIACGSAEVSKFWSGRACLSSHLTWVQWSNVVRTDNSQHKLSNREDNHPHLHLSAVEPWSAFASSVADCSSSFYKMHAMSPATRPALPSLQLSSSLCSL